MIRSLIKLVRAPSHSPVVLSDSSGRVQRSRLQAGKAQTLSIPTHCNDSLPDPLLLHVLNGLVSVQDLENDLAFQVLEGIQVDLLGHFSLVSQLQGEVSLHEPGAQQPSHSSRKRSCSNFTGNGVPCGSFFSPF